MKKVIAGIAISAMALIGGITSAVAAPAPSTLVLSGGSGVYQLDPIVVNATASAAGVVAFKLSGKLFRTTKYRPELSTNPIPVNKSTCSFKSTFSAVIFESSKNCELR